MSAESQDSQPGVELAKELGDSSGDEKAPEQDVGGASPDDGRKDAAWISPAPGTTAVLKQGSKIATWSMFNLDSAEEMAKMRDTTAQREAARTLPVGLRDGLPIGVGSVDLVQLWVKMYPGDLSADLEKVNAASLRRSSTRKLISMREYVRFWGLVIAGALYSQQGRDLWATNITFDGLRDQPSFQRYIPLHRFKYIRSLIKYAKADLDSTVRDPWAWFRRAATEFNANRATILNTGIFATMDESMSAYQPSANKLGGLPNLNFIYRKPKPL
eukprot:jgi/Tetstr1/445800/TSEL_033446.t1